MKFLLSNEIISQANSLYDWQTKTVLPNGETLGANRPGKRTKPSEIPDRRIKKLDEIIELKGKSVLELGCLEGAHTLGLLNYTNDVTAIDCRLVNVAKTLLKVSLFNKSAKVLCCNADELTVADGKFDVVFHCGVLYHLENPVSHMKNLADMTDCMLLDTHIVRGNNAECEGYGGKRVHEGKGIFAGRGGHAHWLQLDELKRLCSDLNFEINELEYREERNGHRICWLLTK
jgi:tRNA (mo5U34)-methyltransferase